MGAGRAHRRCQHVKSAVFHGQLLEDLRRAKLRAIARAARAAREGGHFTLGDIVRILGITKQSVHELMRKGEALLEAQRVRLGIVSLRERRRERLAAAGLEDRRAS